MTVAEAQFFHSNAAQAASAHGLLLRPAPEPMSEGKAKAATYL